MSMARKAIDPSIGAEDLEQEALFAVYESLKNGVDNRAYLRIRAKGAMIDAIRRTDFVSSSERNRIQEIQKFSLKFAAAHGCEPTSKEIEARFGKKAERALVNHRNSVEMVRGEAFEIIVSQGDLREGGTTKEVFSLPVDVDRNEGVEVVEAVAKLPRLQREIVTLRFFEDLPWVEVQERLGLQSKGAMLYHYKAALETLRRLLCES